jgi:hypothetical protein
MLLRFRDRVGVVRPSGRHGRVAGVLEEPRPPIPAAREQPQPVNEHEGLRAESFASLTCWDSSAVTVEDSACAIGSLLSAGVRRPERLVARCATRGAVRPGHPMTEVNAGGPWQREGSRRSTFPYRNVHRSQRVRVILPSACVHSAPLASRRMERRASPAIELRPDGPGVEVPVTVRPRDSTSPSPCRARWCSSRPSRLGERTGLARERSARCSPSMLRGGWRPTLSSSPNGGSRAASRLGRLPAGPHRISLRFSSASPAGANAIRVAEPLVVHAELGSAEEIALRHAPILYGRSNAELRRAASEHRHRRAAPRVARDLLRERSAIHRVLPPLDARGRWNGRAGADGSLGTHDGYRMDLSRGGGRPRRTDPRFRSLPGAGARDAKVPGRLRG